MCRTPEGFPGMICSLRETSGPGTAARALPLFSKLHEPLPYHPPCQPWPAAAHQTRVAEQRKMEFFDESCDPEVVGGNGSATGLEMKAQVGILAGCDGVDGCHFGTRQIAGEPVFRANFLRALPSQRALRIPRIAPVACLLRQRTAAGNSWIAKRLAVVHSGPVNRLVAAATKHAPPMHELKKLERLLKCET